MADSDTHDIDVLNSLIATTIDSAEGYAEAANQIKNPQICGSFLRWSEDRQLVVELLKTQVSSLGGDPEINGTVLASVHRLFTKLREVLNSGDTAVINAVECGEDRIKCKYEEALKDPDISSPSRRSIERAFVSVLTGHDQARALKHSVHA